MFLLPRVCVHTPRRLRRRGRYLSEIPDNKAYPPEDLLSARARSAKKLRDPEPRSRNTRRASSSTRITSSPALRIADILTQGASCKERRRPARVHREQPHAARPRSWPGPTICTRSSSELSSKWDLALGDVERAVKLDKDNHDYLLELYSLRAKAATSIAKSPEGGAHVLLPGRGRKDSAARQAAGGPHAVPAGPRGQTTTRPSRRSRSATCSSACRTSATRGKTTRMRRRRAPNNIEVWSKYIESPDPELRVGRGPAAMERFRNLPVGQSAIDKAAGDMYARQGQHVEAQMFYKKAMARDSIDSERLHRVREKPDGHAELQGCAVLLRAGAPLRPAQSRGADRDRQVRRRNHRDRQRHQDVTGRAAENHGGARGAARGHRRVPDSKREARRPRSPCTTCARRASARAPAAAPRCSTERVHKAVFREKIGPERWLATARKVHEARLQDERDDALRPHRDAEERVDHLMRLRELQDETGGFLAFIPLAFHPENTAARATAGDDRLATTCATSRCRG